MDIRHAAKDMLQCYSAGFVLGKPVTRVTVFIAPRLRKRSMRSKRFSTLRFLDDAEPPLLKLLCWDINILLLIKSI